MLSLNKPFALLNVLIPCMKKVANDHTYCSLEESETLQAEFDDRPDTQTIDISSYLPVDAVTEESLLRELCSTHIEREGTREDDKRAG